MYLDFHHVNFQIQTIKRTSILAPRTRDCQRMYIIMYPCIYCTIECSQFQIKKTFLQQLGLVQMTKRNLKYSPLFWAWFPLKVRFSKPKVVFTCRKCIASLNSINLFVRLNVLYKLKRQAYRSTNTRTIILRRRFLKLKLHKPGGK